MAERAVVRNAAVAMFAAVVVAVTGCSVDAPAPKVVNPPIEIVGVDLTGKPVPVMKPVEIRVENGVIDTATMVNVRSGKSFPMKINGPTATSTQPKMYGTGYRIDYTATDLDGRKAPGQVKFSTVKPSNMVAATISDAGRSDLGVAEPVIVKFDEPVQNRKAAVAAISVESSDGQRVAARWYSDQEVHFRPAEFWKPGTQVKVDAGLYGKDFGGGLYGQKNASAILGIKGEYTVRVSDKDKMVRVFRDGKQVKAFPTSMGKSGYLTYSDTYYLTDDRGESVRMTNNGPESYDVVVPYGTRMSYDGIYLHGAPWAYGALGSYNQSHGCLNLTVEDAKWVYDNLPAGTPVVVTGTGGGKMPEYDGMSDWSIPFGKYGN